jgi:uncharacterized protein YdhG (YjbR/CyaY superfamily)
MNNAVDDYLAKLKGPHHDALKRVQQTIQKTAPDAQQVITYGMPGYKLNGKYLISFAAFKDHMSVFPGSEAVDDLKDQLRGFETSKGTVQFTLDNPLPDQLLAAIVEHGVNRIKSTKQ